MVSRSRVGVRRGDLVPGQRVDLARTKRHRPADDLAQVARDVGALLADERDLGHCVALPIAQRLEQRHMKGLRLALPVVEQTGDAVERASRRLRGVAVGPSCLLATGLWLRGLWLLGRSGCLRDLRLCLVGMNFGNRLLARDRRRQREQDRSRLVNTHRAARSATSVPRSSPAPFGMITVRVLPTCARHVMRAGTRPQPYPRSRGFAVAARMVLVYGGRTVGNAIASDVAICELRRRRIDAQTVCAEARSCTTGT